jgi:hypothetical protein
LIAAGAAGFVSAKPKRERLMDQAKLPSFGNFHFARGLLPPWVGRDCNECQLRAAGHA